VRRELGIWKELLWFRRTLYLMDGRSVTDLGPIYHLLDNYNAQLSTKI